MVTSARNLICLVVLTLTPAAGADPAANRIDFAAKLAPFIGCLAGECESFTLTAEAKYVDGDRVHDITARLAKLDSASFDLDIQHQDYWLKLYRRVDRTVMILPRHKTAFVADGPLSGADLLAPAGLGSRVIGPGTLLAAYMPVIWTNNPTFVAATLRKLIQWKHDESSGGIRLLDNATLTFGSQPNTLDFKQNETSVRIELIETATPVDLAAELTNVKVVHIDRNEIERSFVCGMRRALEVVAPSPMLTMPVHHEQKVAHGQLRWIEGHRVVLLSGSPEQIGTAHGQLLKAETLRCIDSVIHMFGLACTIESGRWFKYDLQAAYQRLEPHIPADHKRETSALADAIGWDRQLVQVVNVFPELFHCSGFAVFGNATRDGQLYHGRVLDYMTTIGLQDSATTFIVSVDGKIPFVTVGYAGFVGSVSGMNERGISLGEMGGRGEGQWDGVPMAMLMRRALEECSTLSEVQSLWTDNPRTCEYFYVFADGKTNQAVGVAATPQSVEFVLPGQTHSLLGDGIVDAVVLSAGDRLETLRGRVQQHHGKIDLETAKWLMSRPVAMKSNLHNVLFVPGRRELYVANADHQRPAAERPYVRIDLRALLDSMGRPAPPLAATGAE